MTDQNTFMEILHDVSEIMKTSDHLMTDQEVLAYFEDMELSTSQKKMIVDYLMNRNKSVDEIMPDNENTDYDTEVLSELEVKGGQTGIDETEENSKVLQAYMEDISLIEKYTQEETLIMYEQLLTGDSNVIETLSHVWITRVIDIAGNYRGMHSRLEDLIQEGNIALVMRLNELCGAGSDIKIGASDIEKDLFKAVETGILDYVSEWNSAKEQENSLIGKLSLVHEAGQYLKELNGEFPTISELSEYTKMTEEELLDLSNFMKSQKEK